MDNYSQKSGLKEMTNESNKHRVSVLIPVYNAEKYLRQCLDSIMSQTYKNIEIVCVNDCSADNSLAILNEYALKDNRFIVIDKPINEGA
jgi:glycosyltransferase involved in cell wall biosynthesis